MRKKSFFALFLCFIAVASAYAQRKVSGTVLDAETGEPVIGASVLVKGTDGLGKATDMDGRFVIENLPEAANSLIVSYVGMKTKEVAIKPVLEVYLESALTALQEQIVVAFGTATKESFTGSAAVVGAEAIAEVQKSNVLDAMTNKVAGVQMYNASGQPGQTTPVIRIRGIGSINASKSPLIVLDGVPYDGDLNTINPADVESMTVLKDAASNALYGARGANGVIMITTKKAERGKSAQITVDAKWGITSKGVADYDRITSPGQYYELYYQALKNQAVMRKGMNESDAHQYALDNLIEGSYGLAYNVYHVPEGESLIGEDGKLNPHATMGNVVNGYCLKADDWMDAAYKNGFRQEYNVAVTQGTDKTSFYTGFGYLKNEGIVPATDYERITARLKVDTELKPWLKMNVNVNYAHYDTNSMDNDGDSSSSGNILAFATGLAPIYPLYIRDAQGNVMVDENGFVMYDFGLPGRSGSMGFVRPVFPESNAIGEALLNKNGYEGNALDVVGKIDVKLSDDLKFTSSNAVDIDEYRSTYTWNAYYGFAAPTNGYLHKSHGRDFAMNFQQILNYHHLFAEKHDVEVMLGHESYKKKFSSLKAERTNMLIPENLELAGAVSGGKSDSREVNYNTEGYFGRAMYSYDMKWFASFSYRRDASSRFAKENRWGNFWSAGAAWLVNKEPFFKADWVDMLKLKASFGSQGNDGIGEYLYTDTYKVVDVDGNLAVLPLEKGNRDITWETNNNFNAGVEFELLGQRLKGSVEYFYRKTTDMLFSFPLPPSSGYTSYYANVGDMRNSGIEFSLEGTIIQTKDWEWNADFNLTHYKNKVLSLPEERKTLTVDGKKGYTSGSFFVGEETSFYTFYCRKYAGVYNASNYAGDVYDPALNGKSMWYRNIYADGDEAKTSPIGVEKTIESSEADKYLCGTALADLYGGFGTSIRWKSLDFSVACGFQLGGKIYDHDYADLMGSPYADTHGKSIHQDILKSWSVDNPDSAIPAFVFGERDNSDSSDRFLISASYLSINSINIGWTLPAAWTRKMKIDKIRLSVNADNVALFSKRKGLDPRQSMTGVGSSAAYHSAVRTISGGIQIVF